MTPLAGHPPALTQVTRPQGGGAARALAWCRRAAPGWAVLCGVAVGLASSVRGEDDFPASWQPITVAEARQQVDQWLGGTVLDANTLAKVRALWAEPLSAATGVGSGAEGAALLERATASFALADPRAEALVRGCQAQGAPPTTAADWLQDGAIAPFVRNNLRLVFAHRLVQDRLYDEALLQIEGLDPADVVDRATLLFCQLVAHHQLVQPEQARLALVRLLEQESSLPRRYEQIARLVEKDLQGLKDESLDHIARRMSDIRRRLEIGRAGPRVQAIEQGVVDSLDDVIKKQEDEQDQQQQQAGASGGAPGGRPMQDSRPAELKAPGLVDRKEIGNTRGWGDLPPKQREQALQQVGRDFPAHYRELIEQYFRELAADGGSGAP